MLGLSYRRSWGSLESWEEQFGEALVTWVRGQPGRLTPFAERLLWAERQARVRMAPHIEALRHELERVLDEAQDVSRQVLRVDARHDLLLPRLQTLAIEQQQLHLELRFAGSLDALRALAQGRCLVAGSHVPLQLNRTQVFARAAAAQTRPTQLIAGTQRRQGLIVAAGNPLGVVGLADVLQRGLRWASREQGSGTRQLLEHLAAQDGLDLSRLAVATVENCHLAVASGAAHAGLGVP